MKRTIIQRGFALLKQEKGYDQLTVVRKLKYLDYSFAEATFSNILTGKHVGDKTLNLVGKGIQELIAVELDYGWQGMEYEKKDSEGWGAVEVKESKPTELATVLSPGFVFHPDGRLTIQQKVDFIKTAEKEVIEFGVTLNTFSSYFISRNDHEFKTHVVSQLEKGVGFKCYKLDPECNEAKIYFADRRQEQDTEIKSTEVLRDVGRRLSGIKKDMNGLGHPGKFEVLSYRHIPYGYFLVVDGGTPNAKMMVSHYLYGLPRAKCPVFEISKSGNQDLYLRYWRSLKKLIKNAKLIPHQK